MNTANAEEVQLAREAIDAKLLAPREAKEAADAAYHGCAFEHQRALREQARIHHALNEANTHLLLVRGKLANETQKAVWSVIETAERALNLSPFDEVCSLEREVRNARLFIDNVGDHLREANQLVLMTEQQMLEAEADQIDRFCDLRDFDLELRLVPLAESEGQVAIDRGNTVTGQLRRDAGEIRQRAAAIQGKIQKGQV